TTDGSFKTTPFFLTYTNTLAVPRSIPISTLRSNMRFPSLPVFSCVALLLYKILYHPKKTSFFRFFLLCFRRYGIFALGLYVFFPGCLSAPYVPLRLVVGQYPLYFL